MSPPRGVASSAKSKRMRGTKKRVQAQRKFAQGAFVPHNNNNTISTRSDDVTTVKETTSIIHYTYQSAKALLDNISFQSVHSHNQPVVILERLSTDKTEKITTETESIESPSKSAKPRIESAESPSKSVETQTESEESPPKALAETQTEILESPSKANAGAKVVESPSEVAYVLMESEESPPNENARAEIVESPSEVAVIWMPIEESPSELANTLMENVEPACKQPNTEAKSPTEILAPPRVLESEPTKTKTESAKAPSKPAKTRIVGAESPSKPAKTRIVGAESPSKPAKTRIVGAESPSKPAKTRIVGAESPSKPAKTRIVGAESPSKPSKTRIEGTESPSKPAKTRIEGTESLSKPAKTRIEGTESPSKPSKTRIEGTESPSKPSKTRIEGTESPSKPSKTRIEGTESPSKPAKTRIEGTESPSKPAKARVETAEPLPKRVKKTRMERVESPPKRKTRRKEVKVAKKRVPPVRESPSSSDLDEEETPLKYLKKALTESESAQLLKAKTDRKEELNTTKTSQEKTLPVAKVSFAEAVSDPKPQGSGNTANDRTKRVKTRASIGTPAKASVDSQTGSQKKIDLNTTKTPQEKTSPEATVSPAEAVSESETVSSRPRRRSVCAKVFTADDSVSPNTKPKRQSTNENKAKDKEEQPNESTLVVVASCSAAAKSKPSEKIPAQSNGDPKASTSSCSSTRMERVRDVTNAVQRDLDLLCKTCARCKIVDKIREIHEAVDTQYQEADAKDDVYEFDAKTDEMSRPLPFYHQRKRRRLRHDANNSSSDENDTDKDTDKNGHNKNDITLDQDLTLDGNEELFNKMLEQLETSKSMDSSTSKDKSVKQKKFKSTASTKTGDISTLAALKTKVPKNENNEKKVSKEPIKSQMMEAPTYHLNEKEFNDPIAFFTKIMPVAEKYGICKVVAPKSFKPKCHLTDEMEFNVTNQYIARMYSRWGPASRESTLMKSYLASQKILYTRGPLVDSIEINIPKLYHVVQSYGGLEQLSQKRHWIRVAEDMGLTHKFATKLENLYVKHILPFDTASLLERQQVAAEVEKCWNRRYKRMRDWALNPLHVQKKLLGESDSSDEEEDEDLLSKVIKENEDCINLGRKINFPCFKKVAEYTMNINFKEGADTERIEKEYWRHVLFGMEQVFVNAASIDTGAEGFGFSKNKSDPCSKHPWNLKMLSSNPGNVLRSFGNVLGVTVPTLHFGMVFSTSCWHRDPHGLPWLEYMHDGPPKIWYGIPDEQSNNFRKAVETLCPTSCQNKSIWLPSDITMIPPNLLQEHNVSLSHVVQNPGEYIIVFPKAYSCSICTGFTVSESVYFATNSWLTTVNQVFQELRESCEPTTFSLEQLLIALAKDKTSQLSVLQLVHASLSTIVSDERTNRQALLAKGLKGVVSQSEIHNELKRNKKDRRHVWNVRDFDDCQICRTTLYLSKVTGITGKNTSLCLTHALRLLETPMYKNIDITRVQLTYFFSDAQLDEVMSLFNKRLQ